MKPTESWSELKQGKSYRSARKMWARHTNILLNTSNFCMLLCLCLSITMACLLLFRALTQIPTYQTLLTHMKPYFQLFHSHQAGPPSFWPTVRRNQGVILVFRQSTGHLPPRVPPAESSHWILKAITASDDNNFLLSIPVTLLFVIHLISPNFLNP